MSLIFVKSIPRPSVLGLSEWTNRSGVKLDKTKVGRAADFLRALYSSKVGGLANYISYHPWLEKGEPVLDNAGKSLMLQQKFEQKWNLPKDYLTNRPLELSNFVTRAPDNLTYFQSKSWKLVDGTTVFDQSDLDGEMGYYVCLASSKIANSEKEWRQHKWPKATHYIATEAESEEIKYERTFKKTKAYALLHDINIKESEKAMAAVTLNIVPAQTALTPNQLHNLLTAYIDASSSNIDKLLSHMSLLNNQEGRRQFEAEYLLQAALDTRVITERMDIYIWHRADAAPLTVGDRKSEVLEFLLSPKKSKEVAEIVKQVKSKIPHLLI